MDCIPEALTGTHDAADACRSLAHTIVELVPGNSCTIWGPQSRRGRLTTAPFDVQRL
jgi:hypothetical protein